MFKTREGTFDSDDSEDECLEIWYDTIETLDLNDQTSLHAEEPKNVYSMQHGSYLDLHNQLWTKILFIKQTMVNYFI
jgi:hypothetical protein